MISYDYYRVFYYVCKYKNFTKAAKVLLTSQSSISHTIQNLEHQLGCRLFIRNNRGIELTREGKQLYDYVAIGCEQFLKGEYELINSVSLHNGIIYLGTTETALHCYLFHALDPFHLNYPGVKFKINNYSTSEAIHALKNGIVDLSVTATPIEISGRMKATDLKTIQDILIAGPQYSHLKGRQMHLSELIDYPIVSFPTGTKARDFMEDIYRSYNLSFAPTIELATSDLILPMVKHNLGLGFVPKDMAEEALHKGEVFQIHLVETIPPRAITVIYDTQHPHSLASKKFLNFLIENAKL